VALLAGLGLVAPVSAAASGWVIERTPNTAHGSLSSVSCVSARACVAVGDGLNGGAPLAERWNGKRWSMLSPRDPGSYSNQLVAVSCTSARACTAVGTYAEGGSGYPPTPFLTLAERWDGVSWAVQRSPSPQNAGDVFAPGPGPIAQPALAQPGFNELTAVSCAAARVCTAVGDDGRGDFSTRTAPPMFAERWNGVRWTLQHIPTPPFYYGSLAALSCPSVRICVAVGEDQTASGNGAAAAYEWNGRRWSVQAVPAPTGSPISGLGAVSCASARACIAVGYALSPPPSPPSWQAFAELWNGTTWAIESTPDPGGSQGSTLRAVSCPSAQACTAVGDYGTSPGLPLALHWNGTTWAIETMPTGAQPYVPSVSCIAAWKCTAVGYVNQAGKGIALAER
jgi:hypothetical protein